MTLIDDAYTVLCSTPSDINEHLPTLKRYAEQSDVIVELGVRYIVSTWALLAGRPKKMLSVDIEDPKHYGGNIEPVIQVAQENGIDFSFQKASSLEIEIPECDFLFIDTLHTYDQLSKELALHHTKAKKFIAMHDTNLAGDTEMRRAINEFLVAHPEWQVAEDCLNNNGMMFLKRI